MDGSSNLLKYGTIVDTQVEMLIRNQARVAARNLLGSNVGTRPTLSDRRLPETPYVDV
jgi:hypothetical protein